MVNVHLQAGCITKEWVSGSKGYLRFPVRLPGLFEEDTAQRQEQGQIGDMPTPAGPLNPGGRQLRTGAFYSSGPDKVPPLPGGASDLATVSRNPEICNTLTPPMSTSGTLPSRQRESFCR